MIKGRQKVTTKVTTGAKRRVSQPDTTKAILKAYKKA
jgi:hypothetical protein